MVSVRALTPELAEKARLELNEDPKRLKDDIQHLKDWIAKQPHLRARTDDQWLIAFLRGSKFSLQKAKDKLDLYYACRTNAPEFYRIKHRDPKFLELLELGTFLVLPKTVKAEPIVAIVTPGTYDPQKHPIADVVSVANIIQKILMMENDHIVIAGVHLILDLESVTFGHFLQMTTLNMKKIAVTSQDAAPFRMRGTHYINTPMGFETVFNATKALLTEKNQTRLYVHNRNYEAMYKFIPKDTLPAEYGGYGGTRKEIIEYWKQKIYDWGPWLDEDEKFGSDEAKRLGKPKTAENMFGIEGFFRKLEFD